MQRANSTIGGCNENALDIFALGRTQLNSELNNNKKSLSTYSLMSDEPELLQYSFIYSILLSENNK